MDEQEASTNNIKDSDEELIEAVAEETLERLAGRGILAPFICADGTTKYQIASKLNRLATANRRRRD